MHKQDYQSPELFLVLCEKQDIVRTSPPETSVDANDQGDWWDE